MVRLAYWPPHMRHARRHFSAQHLDIDDQSAESFFHTTWAYRISVANMRGTAAIIYNVPRGETVPARYKRPTKEDQHRLATLSGRRPFRGRPRGSRNPPRSPCPLHTHSSSDSSSDGCESPALPYWVDGRVLRVRNTRQSPPRLRVVCA